MKTGRITVLGAAGLALGLFAGPVAGDQVPEVGVTHALLINGGSKPASNYLSHLNHLQEMVEMLRMRGLPNERIHIFSADGQDGAADLAVRDAQPEGFWLIDGTRLGKKLKPRTEVTDTRWPGVTLRPAKKAALKRWFKGSGGLLPGDRLLLFVTDHGTGNKSDPDNGAISLWGEKLTVQELKELLGHLTPGVRTAMVMSQCYSGTFAAAMYDNPDGEPSGDACGFFSTTRDRLAYGCYPEGRDRDRIGHAFRFIDALGRREATDQAHLDVLLTDGTPDVPIRTSEVYLERLLADEAESRGTGLDALVDSLLAQAWRDRAAWEPEIRRLDRIGEAFGTFSPRSLAELKRYEQELPPIVDKMKEFARQWKATLINVKEEALREFVAELPEWRERLDADRVEGLNTDERSLLLAELLPQLEWFLRDRPEIWERLEGLRERQRRASEARWRLDVRSAALQRMRSILVAVAGRVFLGERPAGSAESERRREQREALDSLTSCESLEPGELPAERLAVEAPLTESFPPLTDELALLEEVLPSWLGVRYRPVPEVLRAGREIAAGASRLEAVFPDSPAFEAGLEVGDVVLGPPERSFDFQGQLREWTMVSPRGTPLALRVIRPGESPEEDQEILAALVLRPLPLDWPELPGPPQVGDLAPALPGDLRLVGAADLPDLQGQPHLLFFWATWCLPCKKAVPEVQAFAAERGIPVVAITDEELSKVESYLQQHGEKFFSLVATDPLRKSFLAYGVSGTPTMVLVGSDDDVRGRQVGYNPSAGLTFEGEDREAGPG